MLKNIRKTTFSLTLLSLLAGLTTPLSAQDAAIQLRDQQNTQWALAGYTESKIAIKQHPAYRPLKRVLVGSATPALIERMTSLFPNIDFLTTANVAEELTDVDALLFRCGQVDLLRKATKVAWIQTYSAGVDACMAHPEMTKLIERENGIIVTNSSGTAASIIGEHSIAMMMSLSRGLHRFRDTQAQSSWQRSLANEQGLMSTIGGKTMLVLGLGSIGQEVAKRASALGMRVLATRNSSREGPDYVEYVGLTDETLKLAEQADVIVNALPLTDSTRGFIDEAFFTTMKTTALYISVGRGATTDTNALLQALQNNSINGAGLDVTDPEPLPSDHPLWQQENVIITPHISGSGGEAREKTMSLVIENLRRYQAGEALLNLVDTDKGY